MSYTPKNTNVYQAALAGATGGVNSGNVPGSTDSVLWGEIAAAAGAFAQEFDTLYSLTPNTMTVEQVQSVSYAFWTGRNPIGDASATAPATYSTAVQAMLALLAASASYATAQGITPTPIPSSFVVQLATTPDNTPTQTIAHSGDLPDNAATVIDVEIIGKQPGQQEAVSTKVQYTFYRSGSVPQQAGNKTEIVAVTGTAGLAGSTFDVTGDGGNGLIVRASPALNSPVNWKTVFTLTSVSD